MKETRFLVHLENNGYIQKVTREGEWEFTKNLKNSLKFRTITGAYLRLTEALKLNDFSDLKSCILIIEINNGELKVLSKLDYKLSKQRGRPRKDETENEEKKVTLSEVDETKVRKLNEGVDEKPKKKRGRPPKITTDGVIEEPKKKRGRPRKNPIENVDEENKPKRKRGRPRKESTNKEEKKVTSTEVDETKVEKLNEEIDSNTKRGRGRPRKETPSTKVKTNNVSETKLAEPIVKKKDVGEELKTEIVDSDLHVTVVKTSTDDSFWD